MTLFLKVYLNARPVYMAMKKVCGEDAIYQLFSVPILTNDLS